MRKLSLLAALVLALGVTACSDDDDDDCIDLDGDGYGVGEDCLGTDCNDDDSTAHTTITGYPDADEDGEYSDVGEQLCVGSLPTGYSATAGTDCDDDDAAVWESLTGYVDADEDGYGDATAVELCTDGNLPDGYVDNGTDCDDTDIAVWETVTGYQDYDGDGVISAQLSTACTDGDLPTDWVETAGTDCDDFDASAIVSGTDEGCEYAGPCGDTDGDFAGIGACEDVDCNGMSPTCSDTTPTTQTTTCTTDGDCDGDYDEYCFDGNCQRPPDCCEYNVEGLTCSDIPNCLINCDTTYPDPLDYVICLQMECFESATPKAQYLYAQAQACAAEAGCFASADELSCVAANCLDVFSPCLADEPVTP